MTKIVSKKMSLEGWTLKEWFVGNWKTIKEGLKVLVPLALGWAVTNNPELTGGITLVGKFILDLGEYYFKEYTA